jgi:hypothetical protein
LKMMGRGMIDCADDSRRSMSTLAEEGEEEEEEGREDGDVSVEVVSSGNNTVFVGRERLLLEVDECGLLILMEVLACCCGWELKENDIGVCVCIFIMMTTTRCVVRRKRQEPAQQY